MQHPDWLAERLGDARPILQPGDLRRGSTQKTDQPQP